jgi:hypothetical protein
MGNNVEKNNNISIITYIIISLLIFSALIFLIVSYITYTNSIKNVQDQQKQAVDQTTPPVVETNKQYILSDYITIKKVETTRPKLYEKYNVNQIDFKNVPAETVQAFINEQQKSISSINYIENLQDESATPKWVIDMNIVTNIKNNILYIKQFVSFPNPGEYLTYSYNYLAIDVDTNKLVSTKDIIASNNFDLTKAVTKMYNSLENLANQSLTEGDSYRVINKEIFNSERVNNVNKLLQKIDVNSYNIYVDNSNNEYIDYNIYQIMKALDWRYPSGGPRYNESIKLEK